MGEKTIPQRELRNNVAAVLRAAEAGESFTSRFAVDRATLRRILELPVDDDLARDLDAAEATLGDPW